MKKLFFILALGFVGFNAQAQAEISVTDDRIEAVITPETSRMNLFEMLTALAEHGIEMRYDRFNYTPEWKLERINLAIKYGNDDPVVFQTDDMMGIGQIKIVVRPNEDTDKVCVSPNCD